MDLKSSSSLSRSGAPIYTTHMYKFDTEVPLVIFGDVRVLHAQNACGSSI